MTDLRIDRPEPGYYKRRLRSKGPWVPIIIYEAPARDPETRQAMDRAPTLRCIWNGQEVDVWQIWPAHRISELEYERLCKEREGIDDSLGLLDSPVRI